MAITIVDTAKVATASGEYGSVNSITVDLPAGLAAGDVIHLAICLPRYRWYQSQGLAYHLTRQYGVSVPTGWQAAGSYAFNSQYNVISQGIIVLLRKIATGAEGSDVTIPISRTDYRPEVIPDQEVLQVAATLVAHRGVNVGSPYASPPVFKLGGDVPWNSGDSALSRLAQLAFGVGIDPNNANPGVGEEFPAWDDPTATKGQPTEWDVLAQESTEAVETTSMYDHAGEPADSQTLVVRGAALDADTFTPGLAFFGEPPTLGYATSRWYRVAFALRDESEGPAVDEPPAPGQPGVTGSGWVQPEWDGRDRTVDDPLVCTVWGEGVGPYGLELQLLLDEDAAPKPIGLDATFNGLGACTTAQATFAANPGLVPYQHALKFALRLTTDGSGDAVDWWAGVVRNVRYDNGLYVVDLDGFWSLLNDARVQLDSSGDIDRPQHGVIEDTLVLGVGDPTAVVIESEADEQQTWSEHLNNTFRATPEAAWGVGPDQVYVQGLPEQGGVLHLDAGADEAVVQVDAGEFILPPFVTEWWAEASDGSVVSAQLTPQPGLLVPSRLADSRLDDYGNLLTPKEAMYPTYTGPSHTLEYAGIAVPPLRVVNLPSGESQMVASARVSVTVGEEGSMPRITTTLTTVALPYESRGAV